MQSRDIWRGVHNMSFFLLYRFPPFIFLYGLYVNFDWLPVGLFFPYFKKTFRMLLSWYFISFLLYFFSPLHLCTASPSLRTPSFLAPDDFFIHLLPFLIWRAINYFVCLKVNGFFSSRALLKWWRRRTKILHYAEVECWFAFESPQTMAECSSPGDAWRVLGSPEVSVIFLTIRWPVNCVQEKKWVWYCYICVTRTPVLIPFLKH